MDSERRQEGEPKPGPSDRELPPIQGRAAGEGRRSSADDEARWLKRLVESCDEAIISADRDGRILTWTAGAERIFGYANCEAIGRSIAMLWPADQAEALGHIRDQIHRGRGVPPSVMPWRRKDGGELAVRRHSLRSATRMVEYSARR